MLGIFTRIPSKKRSTLKKKEFAPKGSKVFLFREVLISEGTQASLTKLPTLQGQIIQQRSNANETDHKLDTVMFDSHPHESVQTAQKIDGEKTL